MPEFTKPCKTCGAQIALRKTDLGWKAFNPDNTPHRCGPGGGYKPPVQNNKVIGRLQRYNDAAMVFLTEGGILKTVAIAKAKYGALQLMNYSETEPSLWFDCETDQNGFMIVSKEIPKPAWGDAAIAALEAPKEGGCGGDCTCNKSDVRMMFTAKDRLIVAQTLLKTYADVFVACCPQDTVSFPAARAEILAAIKEDLEAILEAAA